MGAEATASVLPRFFQVKFETGLIEEKLFLGNTQETTVSTGQSPCSDIPACSCLACLLCIWHQRLNASQPPSGMVYQMGATLAVPPSMKAESFCQA